MNIRKPAVAGMFYPSDPKQCLFEVKACIDLANRPTALGDSAGTIDRIVGGVVPHAGWVCSGAVAARAINAIAQQRQPQAVIVFGAIHVPVAGPPSYLYSTGAWETPLGLANVDERVCLQLCEKTDLLHADPLAHQREHSIEVELPFIQHLLPNSLIVPIMVPADGNAATLGKVVGQTCKAFGVDAVFLASTDLTHYGPAYGFAPEGVGPQGLRWAKNINDRRMIDLMLAMREQDAVSESRANHNACGAGAIAATIAACKAFGAGRASLLEHTTSYEVLRERYNEPPRDAVGYAGLVFHE